MLSQLRAAIDHVRALVTRVLDDILHIGSVRLPPNHLHVACVKSTNKRVQETFVSEGGDGLPEQRKRSQQTQDQCIAGDVLLL